MNKLKRVPLEMGANETTESNAKQEFIKYRDQMEKELVNLTLKVAESEPSKVKTVMEESFVISRMVESVIHNVDNNLDLEQLQQTLDQKTGMLGLDPSKFSLYKLRELLEKAND